MGQLQIISCCNSIYSLNSNPINNRESISLSLRECWCNNYLFHMCTSIILINLVQRVWGNWQFTLRLSYQLQVTPVTSHRNNNDTAGEWDFFYLFMLCVSVCAMHFLQSRTSHNIIIKMRFNISNGWAARVADAYIIFLYIHLLCGDFITRCYETRFAHVAQHQDESIARIHQDTHRPCELIINFIS